MSDAVVSTLKRLETFTFRDDGGTLVTGVVNSAFTKTVIANGAVSSVVCTVAETGTLSGRYTSSLTPDAVGDWTVIIEWTSDPTFAWSYAFRVETAAQNDPAASLTSVNVTLVSPVSTDATVITLVRGDDYLNADGRAVAFTVSSPSLVGATVTLRIYSYAGVTALSKAMTVSGTTVRADIASSETTALLLGTPAYKFTVTAVLADASTIRPASGTVWVVD